MKKRMLVMLIGAIILFGGIAIYKLVMNMMIKHYIASRPMLVTVSTLKVERSDWQPVLKATGSMRAVNGVNVTTELAGMVQSVLFTSGALVNAGDLLVQLNADSDIALLHALQAQAELANITYERDKKQYAVRAISKQVLDTDEQNLKNLRAQVASQIAIVAKKSIRAPFAGRLGISHVDLGQYINPGDMVVTLQTLDPIYADFYLPQQDLPKLHVGQAVTVTSDGLPGKNFEGKITTIDPLVDTSTRNVEVEATIANPTHELVPGMFALVEVKTGAMVSYLTVPQTVVSYNPYGEIVYVVQEKGKDKAGKPILTVQQIFVTTGETRGDQVAIVKGLKEGETVVSSGQLKLKNGSQVAVNNTVSLENEPRPFVKDEA